MKKIGLIFVSIFFMSSVLFSADGWLADYDEAIVMSQEKGVPILANFTGSDWCGWCIKLKKEVFSQSEFKDYANENLVLLELDFPRRKEQAHETKVKNRELASKYGIRGYPTVLVLDNKGNMIAKTGYQRGGAEKYVEHLQQIVENPQKGRAVRKKVDKEDVKVFYSKSDAQKEFKKIEDIKTIAVQSKDNKLYWGSLEYDAAIKGLKEKASNLGANSIIINDSESNNNILKAKAVYCS